MTYFASSETTCANPAGKNYVIAFTGAGISTEPPSSIPDFRSPGTGLWQKIDPELLSAQTLRADPGLFYRHFRQMIDVVKDRQPNRGHLALAELSRLRIIRAVVTQNIDGLHQKAGSKRVFEVHGNVETCRCTCCKQEYPFDLLTGAISGGSLPMSPCCNALVRPDVVLFGDRMAPAFLEAHEEARRADFALVAGTSLTVFPAAEIPLSVGQFALINRGETSFDSQAVLKIDRPVGDVLEELVQAVRALG